MCRRPCSSEWERDFCAGLATGVRTNGWAPWHTDDHQDKDRLTGIILRARLPLPKHYAGAVGSRVRDVACVVVKLAFYDGAYGRTYVETYATPDGALLVWKGKGTFFTDEDGAYRCLKLGEHVTVTGTIKSHGNYNGEPQTYVQRCRVALASAASS